MFDLCGALITVFDLCGILVTVPNPQGEHENSGKTTTKIATCVSLF